MTTFVIANNYRMFHAWCREHNIDPRDRRQVVPAVPPWRGGRGRRWQDGIDNVVVTTDKEGFRNTDELREILSIFITMGCPREKLPL